MKENFKGRFIRSWALFRLRYTRGGSLFDIFDMAVKNTFYIGGSAAIFEYFGIINVSKGLVLGIIAFRLLTQYFAGWLDEKKLKIWQYEMAYSAKELNPFWEKMNKKIDKLLKKQEDESS